MKVRVEIVTPVFIGSGEEYYPYDYVLFEDRLCFIDRKKLLEKVAQKKSYEVFLKATKNIDDLLDFIDEFADEETFLECIQTECEANEKLFTTKSMPLMAFIKNRFLFKPYIPGSSLKGAIRTALLDYKLHAFWNEIENIERLSDKQLETIIFCNENRNQQGKFQFDAKKDILKALFVSDLEPIQYKLRAIKPNNRPYNKHRDNNIPLVLEALTQGVFEGEIRIDTNLLKKDESLRANRYFQDEPLSIDLIQKALKSFYTKIYSIEHKRFRANFFEYEDGMIKLGKYSGAGSKSLNDLRKVKIRQINKIFDYQLSVWIDSDERPLGWAKVGFAERK